MRAHGEFTGGLVAIPLDVRATSASLPNEESQFTPVPTRFTIAMRTFIPWQLWRFVAINVRMLRMIAKSHD